MGNPVVEVSGLCKGFGGRAVLDNVSLAIASSTVFGLVGLNGAGKTTLIRLLLGLLRPDSGSVSVLGFCPWRHDKRYFRRTGVVLEHDGFLGNLTFSDNMDIFACAKGVSRRELAAYLAEFWAGTELFASRQRVKFFSRGQKMQAALCRAFLGFPGVCFLDEPTVALDLDAYDHFCRMVKEARARGSTVVISSHQFETIESLCDSVGILHGAMLQPFMTGDGAEWIVTADRVDSHGDILRGATGGAVTYDGGSWHFTVRDPAAGIPAIVTMLVGAGCAVREVRPVKDGLREAIRKALHAP